MRCAVARPSARCHETHFSQEAFCATREGDLRAISGLSRVVEIAAGRYRADADWPPVGAIHSGMPVQRIPDSACEPVAHLNGLRSGSMPSTSAPWLS